VFVRLGHVLMIVALLAATGAHWGVLQSVAWTTMLAENLQSGSLSQALDKTFDGKHPCPLCKAVTAGKEAEQKSDFTLELKKLEYPPALERFVLIAPTQFHFVPQVNHFAEALVHEPPTPPPRNLCV
jgi:hypothetical protein